MFSNLILFALLIFTSQAFAVTTSHFSNDGDTVTIEIYGDDLDADRLFNVLNVEVSGDGDTEVKSTRVESTSTWELIFEIRCERTNGESFCRIDLDNQYGSTSIDSKRRQASVIPFGVLDTFVCFEKFNLPETKDTIYESQDKNLRISVERDRSGQPFRFRLEYAEI